MPIERQLAEGSTAVAVSLVSEPVEDIIKTVEILKSWGVKKVMTYGTLYLKNFTDNFGGEVCSYKVTRNWNYKPKTTENQT